MGYFMRGERDDGFSVLYVGDGDKDKDNDNDRNKMAVYDSGIMTSSVPAFSSFRSSSSGNVVTAKRKMQSIFPRMNEYPYSGDSCYPSTFIQKKTPNHKNIQNNPTVDHIRSLRKDYLRPSSPPQHRIAVKKEEFLETFIPDLDLTTDELVKVIGPRLFNEARKTMINQQKMFSWQMFELHRLITVQRHIGRSPETKPPIKLLYVSPLDTSSSSSPHKTKIDAPKSDAGLPLPTTSGHVAQPLPWCFPPPPGNQWLIPVRSPSEGLVYKPYPGPCFPTVYANCGTTYGFPAAKEHGTGGCYNADFPPYPMPGINASSSVKADEVDKSSFDSDFHKQKESERAERDALSLFPTTPSSVDVLKEQKVHVIKVVPYSRDSTPASAARILLSLQEGRTTKLE